MKLISESVKRPVGVIILSLVMIMLGAMSLTGLRVDLMPDLKLPIAAVLTPYNGAAPQEVENLVTRPLEGALSATEGLETIQSISAPNQSVIILMYDFDIDLDMVMLDLRERVDMVRQFLPEGAGSPSVMRFDPNQMPVMQIGVSGDMDLTRLTNIVEDSVISKIERIPGVAQVNITGGQEREIIVEPNIALLQNYGLTIPQLAQMIGVENRSAPAGNVVRGGLEMPLRIIGEFRTLDDIRNITIPLRSGGTVKVSDVAEVKDTFKEMASLAYINGKPTLSIDIVKQTDANTVEVSKAVNKELNKLDGELTEGVKLSVIMDTADFIQESIDNVTGNLLLGAGLAIFILLIFLRSIRSTLIIGLSIPFALISAFTLLYFSGETINIITLGGLALGVGLLVDNSIVILENIFKFRERGYSRLESAVKGASEVAGPVIASTLTSLVVFVPIVFTGGIAAEIFMPLALTVGFTLFASLIVSLTLVPMLSGLLMPDMKREEAPKGIGKIGAAVGNGIDKLNEWYRSILSWVLNHKKSIVFSTLLLMGLSGLGVKYIGVELMPAFDQGELSASFEVPAGTTLEETRNTLQKFEQFLIETNSTEVIYTTVGGGGMMGMGGGGTNRGELYVRLLPSNERDVTTNELIKDLEEFSKEIPDIELNVRSLESSGMGGNPIEVEIRGDDFDTLKFIADDLVEIISEIPGATNIEHSMGDSRPEIQLYVDQDRALQYGLTYPEVMQAVMSSVNGQTATLMRTEGQEVNVTVILPKEDRENLTQLQNLTLMSPLGDKVPLSAVADFREAEGPNVINRQNQSRGVKISGNIVDRDLGSLISDIEKELNNYIFPEGYDYQIAGEYEMMSEAFFDLALALMLAIFLVYAVMAFQFEKVMYPFIVMFSLPATFIGIVLGLVLTGRALSVPAFIGIIMLAGIVVNNAIVLVDYVNKLRERGLSREEAILEAGPTRLRPILMTTLTTVLAMLPLAMGIGEGAELQAPMATVIVFGLTFSTIITLVLVPVMYIYTDNFTNWFKRLLSRNKEINVE